jgi:glycosyltransferase involved in cell wall biosynthesis
LISAVDPFPTDSGKKVVLAGFVDHLADRLGPENVHYLLIGNRAGTDPFPVRLHQLPAVSTVRRLANVAVLSGTGRASLQEAMVRSPEVGRVISATLRRLDVDLEIYDTIRMAQYARNGRAARKICYIDDLHSQRYRLMLAALKEFPDSAMQPLGDFAHHVPSIVRGFAGSASAQRALLRFESRLVERSEDAAARSFDSCLLMNPQEAGLLAARAGVHAERVRAVPPLVRLSGTASREPSRTPVFVFLGLLSLPHNEDGLRDFLRNVWPQVTAHRQDAHLRVIGRGCGPALCRLANDQNGTVSIEGYVPDLDEVFRTATALVNPMRFGTGIKIKVIEALGRGLPVISSPVGAHGIANGGVLVASDPRAMAEAMVRMIDPRTNETLSAAAAAHFAAIYSRAAVFAQYDRAFGTSG